MNFIRRIWHRVFPTTDPLRLTREQQGPVLQLADDFLQLRIEHRMFQEALEERLADERKVVGRALALIEEWHEEMEPRLAQIRRVADLGALAESLTREVAELESRKAELVEARVEKDREARNILSNAYYFFGNSLVQVAPHPRGWGDEQHCVYRRLEGERVFGPHTIEQSLFRAGCRGGPFTLSDEGTSLLSLEPPRLGDVEAVEGSPPIDGPVYDNREYLKLVSLVHELTD